MIKESFNFIPLQVEHRHSDGDVYAELEYRPDGSEDLVNVSVLLGCRFKMSCALRRPP